jgi:hypothetical protein
LILDGLCWQTPLVIDLYIPLLPDSSFKEKMVHIDAFTAMSGVSRFCENEYPWRYDTMSSMLIKEKSSLFYQLI